MKTGYRNGIIPRSAAERLASRLVVDPVTGCHNWTGALSAGYGQIRECIAGMWKQRGTHVVAYETANGPVPAGLVIDHLCRNPSCCNPAHMEAVTPRENTLRGDSPAATNAAKTVCLRGHEFTPENTYNAPYGRVCRACRRLSQAHWRLGRSERRILATDEQP